MPSETKWTIAATTALFFSLIGLVAYVFLMVYPLHIIQNASGFGFVLDGLGGYYWESAQ